MYKKKIKHVEQDFRVARRCFFLTDAEAETNWKQIGKKLERTSLSDKRRQ